MSQITVMPYLADADETITASVKALTSARGYSRDQVALGIASTRRTFLRRLAEGGWTATEVSRLAAFFGVPVATLYSGQIDVTPPRGPQGPDGLPRLDSNQKPPGLRHSLFGVPTADLHLPAVA